MIEHPGIHAMFINTLNVTMINSGIKANVIPAKSEATIDCRLLPGQDREDWRQQVIDVIDDDRIEVEFSGWDQEQPVEVDWDTELYRTIENVVNDAVEDATVVPSTCVGGTDNRFPPPARNPRLRLHPRPPKPRRSRRLPRQRRAHDHR